VSARDLFERAELWPLLLFAPAAWLLLVACERRRARRLERVAGSRGRALADGLRGGEGALRRALLSAGLLLALVAALAPRIGESGRELEPRRADLLVCLDVSRSMLATDVAPSRLEAAKRAIAALAERARGDRLGLVLFAGAAELAVPLTQDLDSFAELAEFAEPSRIARGGTDLGAALDAARAALEGARADHAAVLLISDGEDHEGRGLRAARELARRGFAVHCAGVGSPLGSKIAVEGGGAFLRDRAGREVVSALDAAGLEAIAAAAGGESIDLGRGAAALVDHYERHVRPTAFAAAESGRRGGREPRFQWPLLAAFLLWTLGLAFTDRELG